MIDILKAVYTAYLLMVNDVLHADRSVSDIESLMSPAIYVYKTRARAIFI
jgi:hypothetical protein